MYNMKLLKRKKQSNRYISSYTSETTLVSKEGIVKIYRVIIITVPQIMWTIAHKPGCIIQRQTHLCYKFISRQRYLDM